MPTVLRRVQVVATVLISFACSNQGTDRSSFTPIGRAWASSHSTEGILHATSGDDIELSWVTDVDLDSEGRIYVGDGMADGIVVLDSDLTYSHNIGRRGDGPGEFRSISSVQVVAADSVLVWDSRLRRATVFDPAGHDVRTMILRDSEAMPYWAEAIPRDSGYLVLFTPTYYASGADLQQPRRTNVLRRIVDSPNLADSDSLFAFPAGEALVWRGQDGRGGGAVEVGNHPFGSVPFVAVAGESHVAYATSLALQVTIIDLGSGVQSGFSYETTPVEVTRRQLNAAKDGMSRRLKKVLEEGAPYTWPPVVGMAVDDQDQIWLGLRMGDGTNEWAAFTRDGSHVTSVLLPSAFELYVARGGQLVGVSEDELDVPRVQVYRLPDDENGA